MAEQGKGTVKDTENQNGDGGKEGGEGEPYIPGTSFKSKEDAAKGYQELRQFADRQGTEVGQLRQQLQETQRAIEQMQSKQTETQKAAPKTDYDAELSQIYEQMEKLDPYEDGSAKQYSALNRKAVQLARAAAKEEAMSEASGFLKKELEERDQQQAYRQFYEQNPEFQDPQMQQQIKEYVAKDKTGMSDPLVAFREIQRDQAQARVVELEKELAEKSKLLELKEGTAQTGKVMTKGQGASEAAKTKQPKLSGADLDAAMLEAVRGG